MRDGFMLRFYLFLLIFAVIVAFIPICINKYFYRLKIVFYCLIFAICVIAILSLPLWSNNKFYDYFYYKIYGEEPCAHEWKYVCDTYKGYMIYCPVCDTNQYVSFARYLIMKKNNVIE